MTATTEKKPKIGKILEGILADLTASNEKIVLSALKKIRSKGNSQVINPMLDLYLKTESEKIKKETKLILSELKDKTCTLPMVKRLSENNSELNELILFCLWNSDLDAKAYIAEIVEASCKGNFMVALEGLTVIENLEGPYDEVTLNEAKLILSSYFDKKEDEKVDLIKTILGFVNSFDGFLEE